MQIQEKYMSEKYSSNKCCINLYKYICTYIYL